MDDLHRDEFEQAVAEILRLERMLCDEGVLLLKYWFHLSKEQQKKRLRSLSRDPATRWRVGKVDRDYFRHYDRFVSVCEPFLRQTSTAHAPWIVVPGADPRVRALTVGRHLLQSMRVRLDAEPVVSEPMTPPLPVPADQVNLLNALELDQPMTRADYRKQLAKWQGRLSLASRNPRFESLSVVVVFEGNDGAGKGGAIRRVTAALDARCYDNVVVAAPTDEERSRPYLWRFWRRLPRRGHFALFDRSWYGRVLVERIEGYCGEADWMRAYGEINGFEESLARHHVLVVKFWLAVSKDEQGRRFEERERVAFKRFKLTAEDWRNRGKWGDYETAVCEMVDRTSTSTAPWTLVEANNKYFARIKVLRTLCQAVETALRVRQRQRR